MTMAKPGLAQDQTVEEILASIRQVINGDQPRPASSAPRPPAGASPQRTGKVTAIHGGKVVTGETSDEAQSGSTGADETPELSHADRSQMHDVIELAIEQALDGVKPDETRAETGEPPRADTRPSFRTPVRPRVELRPAREAPRPAAPPPAHEAPRTAAPQPRPAPPRPASPPPASRGLLSPRTNAAVAASFDDLARALASNGSRDIDQTVEDLLRPMLKAWLEDNLPSLVERLVREEIERVSRGGR